MALKEASLLQGSREWSFASRPPLVAPCWKEPRNPDCALNHTTIKNGQVYSW